MWNKSFTTRIGFNDIVLAVTLLHESQRWTRRAETHVFAHGDGVVEQPAGAAGGPRVGQRQQQRQELGARAGRRARGHELGAHLQPALPRQLGLERLERRGVQRDELRGERVRHVRAKRRVLAAHQHLLVERVVGVEQPVGVGAGRPAQAPLQLAEPVLLQPERRSVPDRGHHAVRREEGEGGTDLSALAVREHVPGEQRRQVRQVGGRWPRRQQRLEARAHAAAGGRYRAYRTPRAQRRLVVPPATGRRSFSGVTFPVRRCDDSKPSFPSRFPAPGSSIFTSRAFLEL